MWVGRSHKPSSETKKPALRHRGCRSETGPALPGPRDLDTCSLSASPIPIGSESSMSQQSARLQVQCSPGLTDSDYATASYLGVTAVTPDQPRKTHRPRCGESHMHRKGSMSETAAHVHGYEVGSKVRLAQTLGHTRQETNAGSWKSILSANANV